MPAGSSNSHHPLERLVILLGEIIVIADVLEGIHPIRIRLIIFVIIPEKGMLTSLQSSCQRLVTPNFPNHDLLLSPSRMKRNDTKEPHKVQIYIILGNKSTHNRKI